MTLFSPLFYDMVIMMITEKTMKRERLKLRIARVIVLILALMNCYNIIYDIRLYLETGDSNYLIIALILTGGLLVFAWVLWKQEQRNRRYKQYLADLDAHDAQGIRWEK
jgi:phosphoglycerol transferase MdoB-like AlkP superfamily enzyme